MNDVATELTNSRIIAAYRERTGGSGELAKEANTLFPSGITHDARNVDPYWRIHCSARRGRTNGTSMATAISTTSAGMARCCLAIVTRP